MPMIDPLEQERVMSDKRTHSAILFDLIDRWQKGDVSNRVLIRDLSGMAVNTDHLETANTALEQRVERLEGLLGRAADYIEIVDGVDLHAMVELPNAAETIAMLRKEALASQEEA